MTLREWQAHIARIYGDRDRRRGLYPTLAWLMEEVGELAGALLHGDEDARALEISDALAWLLSVATLAGVDVEAAMARYARGCPKCGAIPCRCPYRDPVYPSGSHTARDPNASS